jgi:hypothetical protein
MVHFFISRDSFYHKNRHQAEKMPRRDVAYSSTPLHFQNIMKFLFRSTLLLLLLGLFGYAAAQTDGPSRPWAAFTKEISVATGISGFWYFPTVAAYQYYSSIALGNKEIGQVSGTDIWRATAYRW